MFTSVGASAAFLVLGIVLFIILCFRGVNTALAALLGAMVVALGSTDGWMEAIFTTFPTGMGNFVINNGVLYLSAGLFAFLMRETKSGDAIADNMVRLIGANRAPSSSSSLPPSSRSPESALTFWWPPSPWL